MIAHSAREDATNTPLGRRKLLRVVVLAVLAALLAAIAFRAYLTPDLLFHFASGIYC